ncbi:MAG: DEAD/DEAH box helicase [Parcubacteria group bacterium]|jgi:superfamily II DNA/RNA helicase
MYRKSERGGQKPSARKTGHASSTRVQKSTGAKPWKKTGSSADDRGQKRSSFKKRGTAGSSSPRPYAHKSEGTQDRASRGTSAKPWKRTESPVTDRGRASRIKKRGATSDGGSVTRPYTHKTDSSRASAIIQDVRTEYKNSDRRTQRFDDRKKTYQKKTPSRFVGGKFSGQTSGRGRNKKKTPVYDHRVFIKEATAQNEDAKQYVSKNRFVDFHLHPKLQKNIVDRGYEHPTPIQDQAIPHAMTGRDVIGIANTGTGKTAAFLLPLLHKICLDPHQQVLILAPTRELALQIDAECQMFTKNMQIQTIVCIGGTSMHKQLRSVRKIAQIIIGTPGRTKDLMQRNALHLGKVNNVVLDEVDRMLDMGFINDITLLLSKVARERQSLFFSATMDEKIAKLTLNYLQKPVTVEISSRPTSENVKQDVIFVGKDEDKLEKLHTVLQKKECYKALIFSRTKMGAKRLAQKLYQRGLRADAIHGDMSQGQRQRALASFRDDKLHILVATDVVARGIDIDGITHVINYDLPETYEDYIHRIGRTGRGIKIGQALTFFER